MSSRVLGGCALIVLGTGAAVVFYAVAPVAATLALWGGGAVWLWWAVSRPLPDTANPAPPPEEDPSPDTKPLVRVIRQDPHNPHRHVVEWVEEEETET